jgi:mannitol/fructose-specific phosphotransferase system IIA component (Ntr-type)
MGTTGIGHGVALPHARTNATEKLILSIIRTKEGIDFGSVDKEPVKLIFTVASPENETNSYMEVMSSIARILSKEKNRRKLNEAKNPKEFLALLKEIEEI